MLSGRGRGCALRRRQDPGWIPGRSPCSVGFDPRLRGREEAFSLKIGFDVRSLQVSNLSQTRTQKIEVKENFAEEVSSMGPLTSIPHRLDDSTGLLSASKSRNLVLRPPECQCQCTAPESYLQTPDTGSPSPSLSPEPQAGYISSARTAQRWLRSKWLVATAVRIDIYGWLRCLIIKPTATPSSRHQTAVQHSGG